MAELCKKWESLALVLVRGHLEDLLLPSSFAPPNHPRPLPPFSFHFFLAPRFPGVTAVSPGSAPGTTLLGATDSSRRHTPRAAGSRCRDVTLAPSPWGRRAGPRGRLAGRGRGRGQGPAPGLRGHHCLRGPFRSPAPRPPGPSGAGWLRQPRPEGHRGFRGWTSRAARCQAP